MAAYFCRMNYRVAHLVTTDSYRGWNAILFECTNIGKHFQLLGRSSCFKMPVLSNLRNVELLP